MEPSNTRHPTTTSSRNRRLRAGDVWLDHGRCYADPETYLSPRPQAPSCDPKHCDCTGLPEADLNACATSRRVQRCVTLLDGAFGRVYGEPSWLVRRGHGSFVTFEFGEPRLEVGEPELRLYVFSPKVRDRVAKRLVAVHGAWHLWIYCCAWRLTHRGRPLARSESRPQRIDSALAVLDGQALVSVSVDADARTTFTFDLGCSLLMAVR